MPIILWSENVKRREYKLRVIWVGHAAYKREIKYANDQKISKEKSTWEA